MLQGSYVKSDDLKKKLIEEIFKALGLGANPALRWLMEPFFAPAARRFAELAISFDEDVEFYGFSQAAARVLPRFTRAIRITGAELIPLDGPLMILSNHPGAYDSLVIASNLPRPDLKIIASGVPFIRSLGATANHLIYSSLDTFERMKVVRTAVRHLENNGALLIFPSGGIDPDPVVMPGALGELETWSPSLEVILRRVPATRILIAGVSGVLHPGWLGNPIIRVRRSRRDRQRVAEFFQVIQQVLFPNSLLVSPAVSFSNPFLIPTGREMPALAVILANAKKHYNQLNFG
jgi:hypothetical protein